MQKRTLHVLVLAYNCPLQHQGHLMSKVLCYVNSQANHGPVRVYLFSDPNTLDGMRAWFKEHDLLESVSVESVSGDLRSHETLDFVACQTPGSTEPVTVFCEQSKRDYLRHLMRIYFHSSDTLLVRGVGFYFETILP